jgi:hypothetical protein
MYSIDRSITAAREHGGDSEFAQPQANVSSKTFSCRDREIPGAIMALLYSQKRVEMHRIITSLGTQSITARVSNVASIVATYISTRKSTLSLLVSPS